MQFSSEHHFQSYVIKLAKSMGYKIFHQGDARTIEEGKGFVDLVLLSTTRHKLIFAELKMPKGVVSNEQIEWGAAIATLGIDGVYYALWTPRHASKISEKNQIRKALSGPVSHQRRIDFMAVFQKLAAVSRRESGQPDKIVAQLQKQKAQGVIR